MARSKASVPSDEEDVEMALMSEDEEINDENKRSKKKKEKTIEERYTKLSQLEHILTRPDTYVGSITKETVQLWTWDPNKSQMVYKSVQYVPAMYKIFDEILVNAADVKARELYESKGRKLQKMTKLDISVDREAGSICVLNDGAGIPVEVHKTHGIYVPELIFGHLLTSDNYDDTEERVTGGRNGYGAKLTNIFSTKFRIECVDSQRKRKFKMEWRNNMSEHTEPDLLPVDLKSDSCKITFWPDFQRLNMPDGFDDDIYYLLEKRAYDMAGTVGVKVSFNKNVIPIRKFKDYVDLYFPKAPEQAPDPAAKPSEETNDSLSAYERVETSDVGVAPPKPARRARQIRKFSFANSDDDDDDDFDDESIKESSSVTSSPKSRKSGTSNKGTNKGRILASDVLKIYEQVNELWEVVFSLSDGQFQHVSFVNNICTSKGGTHINYIVEPVVQAVMKKCQSKGGMEIKPQHVRNHMFVFVNCRVVNPSFSSQTKEFMTKSMASIKPPVFVSDRTISAVVKSSIAENVVLWAHTKEQVELKRKMKSGVGGRNRERILGIPKLEDANDAGTKNSHLCTLILTEGDSAKTSCIAGLSVVGKDRYGVFPLRGKILNVRDAGYSSLTSNVEIQNLLKITGLEIGKKITDPHSLRYGCIMIMTDQDYDGSHIKGLLINLLHKFWPDLLKYRGFLKVFVTPIVKVSNGRVRKNFFTLTQYETWKEDVVREDGEDALKQWKIKYYKGLGTSDNKEFQEYFQQLSHHSLEFVYRDEDDFESIDMAFNSKRAEDRKSWISSFEEGTFLDHTTKHVRYKDFVNKELVLFSRYDLERSIPCIVDGLKPAQRKALFGAFTKKLVTKEMKVAQFAAYVSDVSCYHHGEESMAQTVVGLAQNFVGSNNLNILFPSGQFGSRKEGGKDASATRYIYTRLTNVARAIYRAEDEPILQYRNEEGKVIEPKWYVPVIPMILVNGTEGIGTGWSSSIPNFNPRDIIKNIRLFLAGAAMEPMAPWYRGFIGHVVQPAGVRQGWETVGVVEKIDETTLFISELPIRTWTQPYKEFLEALMQLNTEQGADASAAAPKASAAKAKGKAKAKAKSKAQAKAVGRGFRGLAKTSFAIEDYRDNSTHEVIAFTVKLTEAQMNYVEANDIEKCFKLRKALPISNMTLFDATGKVLKYDTELDILRDFCAVRLQYYEKRRNYKLVVLQKELCWISNKLKFVLAVIEGRLKVSNRKKAAIEEELDNMGFDRSAAIDRKYNTRNPTLGSDVAEDGTIPDPGATQDEEAEEKSGAKYQYLLSMSLYSLTYEKVEELKRQYQAKEQEYQKYLATTIQQLWLEDLTDVENAIDVFERSIKTDRLAVEEARRAAEGFGAKTAAVRAKPKQKAAAKKPPKKEASMKPPMLSDDDDDDDALFAKLRRATEMTSAAAKAQAPSMVTSMLSKKRETPAEEPEELIRKKRLVEEDEEEDSVSLDDDDDEDEEEEEDDEDDDDEEEDDDDDDAEFDDDED